MRKGQGQAELDTGACAESLNVATLPLFSSTLNAVGEHRPAFTLDDLLTVYEHKDIRIKNYLETKTVKVGDRLVPLAQIKEHNQKKRYAQYLNLTDTFNKVAGDSSLNMAFVTITLKGLRFNSNDVEIVKYQSGLLRHFHRTLRDDRLFREPTQKRMKRLGMKEPWYHINTEKFQYIYTLEFQKDLTLHSHCAYYIPDSCIAFLELYKTIKRKRENMISVVGRTEYVIPAKFKDEFIRSFSLERFDNTKPDCYVESGTNVKGGDFLYIKFINDDSKYQKDYYTQVMRYITKYVMKGIGMREDGTGNIRERNEDVLIRHNKLRMISYSRVLVPFFIYNKFYKELQKRKLSLYDMIILKREGKVDWQLHHEEVIETYKEDVLCDSLDDYTDRILILYENGYIDYKILENYASLYKDYSDDQYDTPEIECIYMHSISKKNVTITLDGEVITKSGVVSE